MTKYNEMINQSNSDIYYVVKFDSEHCLTANYDYDTNHNVYDVYYFSDNYVDDDMFFRTEKEASMCADEFMKTKTNITFHKCTSYTIHKVKCSRSIIVEEVNE